MKKYKTSLACLLLVALLFAGCSDPNQTGGSSTAPENSGAVVDNKEAVQTEKALEAIRALGESPDDNYRTWYEIFVYSFCDSDSDGIGDLNGVTSKLDYLQELGVNGIWLMPIHPSTTYHKYNVSDYYEIDAAYGTMEDFEKFMAECEKRDIHVILDLVLNHTGDEHEWFKTACNYLVSLKGGAEPNVEECQYVDYYFFTKEYQSGYTEIAGTSWYYESQFSPDMPDLNLGNEAVRAEIKEIMKFWIDKGVAGFRLDAAKEFYSGSTTKNVEVLSWISETAKSLKDDAYLVAEVWDSFATITDYYESGISSIFNYAFGDTSGKIVTTLRSAGSPDKVKTYATALEKADKAYSGSNPDYIDAPFLSNHDVGRIAGFCSANEQKTKLAAAMNLFMSGSAFIYYGEEIGMTGSGNDPSKRAPMYWNAERDEGTTDAPPECEVPETYPFASLEEQQKDDASIYNYYRQAIAIRSAIPAISHGRTTAETALNKGCVSAYRKTWGEEACIVLMNVSEESAELDLAGYEDWKLAASLSADGKAVEEKAEKIVLPAYGTAVLLPE